MNPALIVMTILGCNDAGTECHYITTLDQRWSTVAMCDSVSENHLPQFANQPYPVIIAVCQKPDETEVAKARPVPRAEEGQTASGETRRDAEPPSPPQVSDEEKQTLASRAIERVKGVLPTTEGVKTLVKTPVRLVEDGYSWVARRFDR